MAIVKELHLWAVVDQVAGWVVLVVAEIRVVLGIGHGASEHLIEMLALHWPWDYLVVHSAEHL